MLSQNQLGSGVATLLVEDIPNFAGAAGPRQRKTALMKDQQNT